MTHDSSSSLLEVTTRTNLSVPESAQSEVLPVANETDTNPSHIRPTSSDAEQEALVRVRQRQTSRAITEQKKAARKPIRLAARARRKEIDALFKSTRQEFLKSAGYRLYMDTRSALKASREQVGIECRAKIAASDSAIADNAAAETKKLVALQTLAIAIGSADRKAL